MKLFKFYIFFFILFTQNTYCQKVHTNYIIKDTFTKIISITEIANHGDDFVYINVFNGEIDKVQWDKPTTITSYRYLGVDNQNNLHIQRNEHNFILKDKDECVLVYKLELNKPTEITLLAQRTQKNPVIIKIQVEANNNFIKTKYLGDLPIYSE